MPTRAILSADYRARQATYRHLLDRFARRVQETLESEGIHASLRWRLKDLEACYRKLRSGRSSYDGGDALSCVTDLLGLRVVCSFVDDVARVQRVLSSRLPVVRAERVAELPSGGGESVVLTVRLPGALPSAGGRRTVAVCEIQIRTLLQDALAEVRRQLVLAQPPASVRPELERKLSALGETVSRLDEGFRGLRGGPAAVAVDATPRG